MEPVANDPVANGKTELSHRFDSGSTLTYERTDGPTDDYQDQGSNPSVLNPSGGVDEFDSMRLVFAADEAMTFIGTVFERLPVLNREPRPESEANRQLWGALMRRDGSRCWMCNRPDGFMVIDHLIPRSSFVASDIHLADRSDNLRIACWDCNQEKSNRDYPFKRPLPIVWMCREDIQVNEFGEVVLFEDDELVPAYCARHNCAVSVPIHWGFAGLGGVA
jgi:hypothetical protein